jgi:molecular chaperone GrpE
VIGGDVAAEETTMTNTDNSVNVEAVETQGTSHNGTEASQNATGGTETQERNSGVPDATAAYITALQADLEEARTRAEDAEKRLVYAQAEFQNVLRRREEQYRGDQKYANSELIKLLLPVIDNFERALKAAEQARNLDALLGGVSGTHKQLLSALEKAGVTPIASLGKEFDPNYHEAIGHAEESDLAANTVAEELQRGYIMHDRVLRPALVKVAGG